MKASLDGTAGEALEGATGWSKWRKSVEGCAQASCTCNDVRQRNAKQSHLLSHTLSVATSPPPLPSANAGIGVAIRIEVWP